MLSLLEFHSSRLRALDNLPRLVVFLKSQEKYLSSFSIINLRVKRLLKSLMLLNLKLWKHYLASIKHRFRTKQTLRRPSSVTSVALVDKPSDLTMGLPISFCVSGSAFCKLIQTERSLSIYLLPIYLSIYLYVSMYKCMQV